ncbi:MULTISPECIES: FAD-dependent thymidylate synthase [Prochlorococcus]|uniref:FAD-dependent thymidylate synthase n=1 Tax=Prochlorococcus marinus (strain SARG / CCMP1375 / SS120) TaxID=167539 RepID=Q7VDU5_PROMA|nr:MULTISPECIES: FAD-dependent thymidylate synthase [Prochlorococcus]AAP99319.1 Predicted alternative thymidylate synthase [Prochlorococcus marinus subsp. marinus str. CCMP1375]KGG11409.1 Thymidylate synthase thyX [Prochlorococcus marinus str. LG]KGG18635.1 Thymidylate synthase thyX [Prochlorococcus marinus str. SS2]KGG22908.1 Thymidylate synthase thyX [Prochlorococcus marinus str. SS35]KGG32784.1 Thymidylate synthase thyX [Prochlorococcus marinus str. SS51]
MNNVHLVTATPDAEKTMAYIARVSNPKNQANEEFGKLIKYCINNEHWSVFEQAYMTLQIETNRAIAAQILRHRSFTFQEFSQRYADSTQLGEIPIPELRRQDSKNRQNSTSDLDEDIANDFREKIKLQFKNSLDLYQEMLDKGVAKESARFILPLATPTRIYMTGSCRSWLHYINLRSGHGTQKEHLIIAKECKKIFTLQFPKVSEALGWIES